MVLSISEMTKSQSIDFLTLKTNLTEKFAYQVGFKCYLSLNSQNLLFWPILWIHGRVIDFFSVPVKKRCISSMFVDASHSAVLAV